MIQYLIIYEPKAYGFPTTILIEGDYTLALVQFYIIVRVFRAAKVSSVIILAKIGTQGEQIAVHTEYA